MSNSKFKKNVKLKFLTRKNFEIKIVKRKKWD